MNGMEVLYAAALIALAVYGATLLDRWEAGMEDDWTIIDRIEQQRDAANSYEEERPYDQEEEDEEE